MAFETYELCEHYAEAGTHAGRRCAECQATVDEAWLFWEPLVTTGGQLDIEKVKAELSDFGYILEQVSKVYDEISGGTLSKPNYPAETVLGAYRQHAEKLIAEAKADD